MVVLCCVVSSVVVSAVWCVVWCVLRGTVKNPVCVCTGTTRTCFNICARDCRHTWRRFDRTHGDVLDGHTEAGGEGREGHRQFCLPKFAHIGLSRDPKVHQK